MVGRKKIWGTLKTPVPERILDCPGIFFPLLLNQICNYQSNCYKFVNHVTDKDIFHIS
jgi:hypothetical protein